MGLPDDQKPPIPHRLSNTHREYTSTLVKEIDIKDYEK